MTKEGDFDLTALDLYNHNGGVVQGQICGQGLMTKLLRNKQKSGKGLADNALLFSKDPTLCMNPITTGGKNRKMKYNSHSYENMNGSSNDTESCSSSEGIFSELSSNVALHQTIEDIQQPTFVAQFDPRALPPPPQSGPSTAKQHRQPKNATPPRKRNGALLPWSTTLPAVVEEQDSQSHQSEQSSQQSTWRLGSPANESSSTVRFFPQSPHFTLMSLQENSVGDQYTEQKEMSSSSPSSQSMATKTKKEKKPSKQQLLREAMERRIQQAMDKQLLEEPQQQENHNKEQQLDMFQRANGHLRSSQDNSTPSNMNEEDSNGTPNLDFFENTKTEVSFSYQSKELSNNNINIKDPSSQNLPPNEEVTRSMHDLLLQQQMSLKEMSLQNYHYRKELAELKETLNKSKSEQEQHQATIETLTKEKEDHAKESQSLRRELAVIRSELEELKKETKLHAEYTEYQNSKKKQKEKQRQRVQPQHTSPKLPELHGSRVKNTPSISPAIGTPPRKSVTIVAPHERGSSNRYEKPMMSNASKPKPDYKPLEKPIVSGFKSSPSPEGSTEPPRRTVKFHDPPMNKEWTLFPANLIDEDARIDIFSVDSKLTVRSTENNDGNGSDNTERPLEARQQQDISEGDHTNDIRQVREACGTNDYTESSQSTEVAAIYKYRLEAIQKNRQERVARRSSDGMTTSKTNKV